MWWFWRDQKDKVISEYVSNWQKDEKKRWTDWGSTVFFLIKKKKRKNKIVWIWDRVDGWEDWGEEDGLTDDRDQFFFSGFHVLVESVVDEVDVFQD